VRFAGYYAIDSVFYFSKYILSKKKHRKSKFDILARPYEQALLGVIMYCISQNRKHFGLLQHGGHKSKKYRLLDRLSERLCYVFHIN
jgi:hypothetical protein